MANGDHDGDVYSAYLGGGYRIDREAWSWGSEAALRAATMFEIAHGLVISELWGGRSYDFGIDDRVITAHFAGAPNVAFSTDGQDVEHWAFVTGGGDTVKGHRNGGIRLKGDDVSRVKRVLSIRC